MTIEVTPRATAGACRCHGFSQFRLTVITRDFAKLRAMHGPTEYDLQAAATLAGNEGDIDCELRILRDVFRLLPSSVTVQDDRAISCW